MPKPLESKFRDILAKIAILSKITIFARFNTMSTFAGHIKILVVTLLAAMAMISCQPDWTNDMELTKGISSGNAGGRTSNDETRKVMLLYSAGFNSLSSYLKSDIEDLKKGWIPDNRRTEDIVLIYSHFTRQGGGYSTQTSPTLIRLYRDKSSEIISDTLMVYPEGTISASAEQLNNVLTYVKDNFAARSYGMIFSSHATGYLPAGYYNKTDGGSSDIGWGPAQRRRGLTVVPYVEPEYDPSLPMVKSIGQDLVGNESYEIEITDFAEAIPMYMDYILFDACLMGGVEVAYELKDKVGKVGFSQTEVLAEGYCYETLTSHLLEGWEADPQSVCEDFYNQYARQSGVYQSATISLIDCSQMDPLTRLCKELFKKYSASINSLNPSKVQRFYRGSKHWFYDLKSILTNAGINESELRKLRESLNECVIYKANTPMFMSEFEINTFSGFSMYLPSNGSNALDTFYKTLKWNQETGLVN